jgi:hypothetical protein
MAKKVKSISRFIGGIADYESEGTQDTYSHGRSIDVRSNPRQVSLLPKTIKESGNVIEALPKWSETVVSNLDTYIYDEVGNIYKRTSAASYSLLRRVSSSHGNGLSYFGEDDYLYYTLDKVVGRYGSLSGTPSFTDDFLGAQGGVPLNTSSLDLEAGSSQYASRASSGSLQITGNLAIEAQIKPESLPTTGNAMVIASKWDESGATRSYHFDLYAASGYFGDGGDGALTISTNTTDAPIDSACTGTINTTSLSATNTSFAAGQVIFIHQSQGTGAGTRMRNKIQAYTAGTITLETTLNATYSTGAQVLVLKEYTNVTVNAGVTWTAKAWNGTVGGILAFLASGTVTVNGTISASGSNGTYTNSYGTYTAVYTSGGGFRGGMARAQVTAVYGNRGEGDLGGWSTTDNATAANGSGGGAGYCWGEGGGAGGGGGSNATVGVSGNKAPYPADSGSIIGAGATTITGSADLTSILFGGGGGGGANDGNNGGTTSEAIGAGGSGGGIVFITATTLTMGAAGLISANGGNGGEYSSTWELAGGGGGAGGSILLKTQTGTLGTTRITASGGTGGTKSGGLQNGGNGGSGRIHIDYYTSYTGTTTPTIDATQDNSLAASTDSYQLRLLVSDDGTAVETLSKTASLVTDSWQHVAVSLNFTDNEATFYLNGVSLGTVACTAASIDSNSATFQVGMSKDDAGDAANFFDGLIDEVRVFNTARSQDDFSLGINQQIPSATPGLVAYYNLNGDYADATSNSNDLTASGSPVFSTDVPYPSPTTRLDIDQSATTTGNTYTLATTISETAANRKTFTPAKDPQKSVAVLVVAKGTGNWTLTVHDQYNNTVASKTLANANITVGDYTEFVFDTVWRPITNFTNTYHFHVTSTVADGTVTTTDLNDLSTVSYRTYYQFLVEDTAFHPMAKMLQFLVIGNERYIAKYEATTYEPNKIVLPAGYRVRCYGYWQEFLAIGVTRGSNIYDTDQGRVYFWDGIAPTYNFFRDVPEGGVNALCGTKDKLYAVVGYQGEILKFNGGEFEPATKIPKTTENKYVEVLPQAITVWKSLMRIGVAGGGDSTEIERGVYTFGKKNIRYPDALTYDYPISTGTRTSTGVKIGFLTVVNKKLLIGRQDNVGYGIDYVDADNDCFGDGTIEFLVDDNNMMFKEQRANTLLAVFDPLESGQSIDIKYKLDSDTDWTALGAVTTADETEARIIIPDGRCREHQFAVDLASTSGTSPVLKNVALEWDDLKEEKKVGK